MSSQRALKVCVQPARTGLGHRQKSRAPQPDINRITGRYLLLKFSFLPISGLSFRNLAIELQISPTRPLA